MCIIVQKDTNLVITLVDITLHSAWDMWTWWDWSLSLRTTASFSAL